jgi:hypothetical protein
MPTARQRLEATLIELQEELAELPELQDATREKLRATLSDIRAALATQSETAAAPAEAARVDEPIDDEDTATEDASEQSLGARLNDATREIESTHPELATTLGSVINALGQMGI